MTIWRTPNYNLLEPAYDGWWMPRWCWHLFRVVLSVGTALLLYVWWPLWWAAGVGTFLTGVLSHILGVALGRYPFDPRDWVADAVLSSYPLVVVGMWALGGSIIPATLVWTMLYLATYPFASP